MLTPPLVSLNGTSLPSRKRWYSKCSARSSDVRSKHVVIFPSAYTQNDSHPNAAFKSKAPSSQNCSWSSSLCPGVVEDIRLLRSTTKLRGPALRRLPARSVVSPFSVDDSTGLTFLVAHNTKVAIHMTYAERIPLSRFCSHVTVSGRQKHYT